MQPNACDLLKNGSQKMKIFGRRGLLFILMALGSYLKQTPIKMHWLAGAKYGVQSLRDFLNTVNPREKKRVKGEDRPSSLLPSLMIRVLYLLTSTID